MANPGLPRPRNILLAVDGSEHSLAAVMLLRDLPLQDPNQPDCLITALGVLLPRNASSHEAYRFPLEAAKELLHKKGFAVQTELITGYPAETILKYAEEHRPDLIVVGAKGLRATLGILLGGTAQQVVEYACCPVLVVRAPYLGLKKVLLVTDGSPLSLRASQYLQSFPLPPKTQLQVAHVLPPPPLLDPVVLARTWSIEQQVIQTLPPAAEEELQKLQAEDERRGRLLLEQTIQELQVAGLQPSSVLLRGDAATEIIEYVQSQEINLIVAGSRGLSQVQSWLLGSVSRKLVHYAGCSVMIVKTPAA